MLRTGLVLLVAALMLMCGAAPVLADEVIYDFPLDSDPGWYCEGGWEFGTTTCGRSAPARRPAARRRLRTAIACQVAPPAAGGRARPPVCSTAPAGNVTLSFGGCSACRYTAASVEETTTVRLTTVCRAPAPGGGRGLDPVHLRPAAVADDRPVVYVRWSVVLPPPTAARYGFDIDDIQITGDRMPPNELIYNPLSYNRAGHDRRGRGTTPTAARMGRSHGQLVQHVSDVLAPRMASTATVTDTLTTRHRLRRPDRRARQLLAHAWAGQLVWP
jgi:hypothetical protein